MVCYDSDRVHKSYETLKFVCTVTPESAVVRDVQEQNRVIDKTNNTILELIENANAKTFATNKYCANLIKINYTPTFT